MIGRLNHVAIAVERLDSAIKLHREALGATVSEPVALPEHGVSVAFVEFGESKVELLEPLGEGSPHATFLKDHPDGGLHHLCFETPDLAAARDAFIAQGRRVLGDGGSKIGAHGRPVLFLHPKDCDGTLIELEEV